MRITLRCRVLGPTGLLSGVCKTANHAACAGNPRSSTTQSTRLTLSGRLRKRSVRFFAGGRFAILPTDAVALVECFLLDLLAVAPAGHTREPSRIIHNHAAGYFAGNEQAVRLLLDGREVRASRAALAGGMTIDSVDAHDGHQFTKGYTGYHQYQRY